MYNFGWFMNLIITYNTLVGLVQNVLHWHIVDTQSFPLEIPSYPKLWKGAYSSDQRYTFEDATDIVKYVRIHK